MIILNTTFVVDPEITSQFTDWAKQTYIPATMLSGLFNDPMLSRIFPHDPEQTDAESFALQLKCDSVEIARQWIDGEFIRLFAPIAQANHGRIMPFTTLMEII